MHCEVNINNFMRFIVIFGKTDVVVSVISRSQRLWLKTLNEPFIILNVA